MMDINSPRDPLPETASQYLSTHVYPILEPALEAMLQVVFPADSKAPEGEEELPREDVNPLKWLAHYLKSRNRESLAMREAATWEAALQRTVLETDSIEGVYTNGVVAARNVFWPCSVTLALKDVMIEETPAEQPPEPAEGEGEEAEAQEGEEEQEPKPVPMIRTEVPILRYVATGHPDKRSIEGWVLRYEEQGVTGKVLQTGEPMMIAKVEKEPRLFFFNGSTPATRGSYCAVPLKELETGEVYGVLCMDTLLDGRELTPGQLYYLREIGKQIDQVREPFAKLERKARAERERLEKQRLAEEAARKAAEEEEERRRKEEEEGGTEDQAS